MTLHGNSYSTLTETEFFDELIHAIAGSSEDHQGKRIAGLEELRRRILSNTLQDKDKAIKILLDMAKKHCNSRPESSLITKCFVLSIQEYKEAFQTILNGLGGQEGQLFVCFSKAILALDYKKKKQSIPILTDFLMTRDNLGGIGIKEAYDCLVSLGDEKLGQEIVKVASQYLNSSPVNICANIYSVRLCAKFAGNELVPNMMDVVERSKDGYFRGHSNEIEENVCQFFERVNDQRSLPILLDLLKIRTHQVHDHIVKAVAKVLDTYPNSTEYVIEVLYDNRRNARIISAILECFAEMEAPEIDPRKILSSIHLNWWKKYQNVGFSLHSLFVKIGKLSNPILLEMMKDEEKFDFALECLKEIGISREELSKIFPEPPMKQVYKFFYSKARGSKIPKDLNQLWEQKEKLIETIGGVTDKFEHLVSHIFTGFNFVTLNVAPLQIKSVDTVCFNPETLDLFLIACTTGTLQDDLPKMHSLIEEMQTKVPDIFQKCSVIPILASSEMGDILPSHKQYAAKHNITIMKREGIDTLLEMLNTNRESRKVVEYIKSLKEEQSSRPMM